MKYCLIAAMVVMALVICAPVHAAEPAEAVPGGEKAFCYGADMAFFSRYVSRGLLYSDDPVFQPNAWASYKGFTFNVWGNLDLTDYNGWGGNFYELDYGLDYSGEAGPFEYSAGALYYSYPHFEDADTAEVYAGIEYESVLDPALTVYYDFWRGDGVYAVFSISHGFGLPDMAGCAASLDLSAQVGLGSKNYNVFSYGSDHTDFTDYVLKADLPVALSENVTVAPSVSYSSALNRRIRTKIDHDDAVIWGGVISASF